MSDDQRRSRTAQALPHRIKVLGAFTLTVGGASVALSVDARRLVAYLAIHPRPQSRVALAADLWPGIAAGERLLADALGAVDVPGLLDETDGTLALAADVEVDFAEAMRLIRALPTLQAAVTIDTSLLTEDILPGWTAAWIAIERERFRQLRLHSIEERSQRLITAGRFEDAVAMAKVAVRTAPSRESARRALMEAYVALGDLAAAVNEYDEYQELLRSSLGGPAGHGLEGLLPMTPAWPVLRARSVMPRSAVQLPGGIRAARSGRRLVAGGSAPGNPR
ncbi:MAG TPA: bacterial transcriptional activator domain-containing protein [Pseudonocardia sp.]